MATVEQLQSQLDMRLVQRASEAQKLTPGMIGNKNAIRQALIEGNSVTDPATGQALGNQRFTEAEADEFLAKFEFIAIKPNDNYGYAAVACVRIDGGPPGVYVGVRSTENRSELLGGDYIRDSTADKQILQTGFAFGQGASHDEFIRDLHQQYPGQSIFQSAYSLSGNMVSSNLLAYDGAGTLAGHLAVNATGAGSVGDGTYADMKATFLSLRSDPLLTDAQEKNIMQRLGGSEDPRWQEFSSLYQTAKTAYLNGGANYWTQPLPTLSDGSPDTSATVLNPIEQFAGKATSVLYLTSYSVLGSHDSRLDGISYIYGSGISGFDSNVVANGGLHGPTEEVPIPGQPLIIAGNGLFNGVSDTLNGKASANSDAGTTHSAILVDDVLRLKIEFTKLNPNLTDAEFRTILRSSGYSAASLYAADNQSNSAEGDTVSSTVNGLGRLLGLNIQLQMDNSAGGAWKNRDEFIKAIQSIDLRINQLKAAEPNIQMVVLAPEIRTTEAGTGVSEVAFYSDLVARGNTDTEEGRAIRCAMEYDSPIALVNYSVCNAPKYDLPNYPIERLNKLAGDYVDCVKARQQNMPGTQCILPGRSQDAISDSFEVNNTAANFGQTLPTGTNTEAPAATTGIALAGGGYDVTMAPATLNNNTDAFSALISSTVTNNRPGAFQTSDTGQRWDTSGDAFKTVDQITQDIINGTAPSWSSLDLAAAAAGNSHATQYVPADPLVLDLNGDGVKLTSYAEKTVLFDIDHDGGSKEQTGWVSAQDGILVMPGANNIVNDISETFSEYFDGAVGTNGEAGEKKYANGFEALRSLNSNNAGTSKDVFDSQDIAFNNVKVWIDANSNGITDTGELKTLAELNITSINLTPTAQSGLVNGGNEVLATGTFTQNGATQQAQAANFIANPYGQTLTAQGAGTRIDSQTDSGTKATYVSHVTTGEVMDAATLNVANITGNAGNDTLTGDANANWLAGGQGSDTFNAGASDDILLIDAEDLQANIHGGAGNDIAQVIGDAGVTLNLAQAEIEAAVGGRGNDILIGGGRSSVFIRAGAGDDIVIGGAANDALSGENGNDLIDGGAGNDIIRGGRGQDQLMGGAGDDIVFGGQDDDRVSGGTGNDVLRGEQGDDTIDGGDGIDIAEFSGSFADYRITRVSDTSYRVVDTKAGRDGADMLTNIEKLNFADVSAVDITLDNPLPVRDTVTTNANGQAISRSTPQLIAASQLLANDRDWQGDALHITEVLEAVGGTASLTVAGDVLFTPTAGFTGVMSFKYKIADADGTPGATAIDLATGQNAQMKAAVYLVTPEMPTDALLPQQWYITDTNILPVWQEYTGKGVSIAQFEPGMPFSTGPEVFNYRQSDLQGNVDPNWIGNPNADIPQDFSQHATLVAGVMVAQRNGEGVVGVAYDAKLSGHYIQGTGLEVGAMEAELTNALAQYKNYDVVNNSWGSSANFDLNVVPVGSLEAGLMDAVQNGRHGLGTAVVFAAGNDRAAGGNANANALINNRAVITVGAINAPGDIGTLQLGQKPFSDPGANILVSAPGSNIASTGNTLLGDDGTVFGADTQTTQGTSFATPIVSGVIALMLEANPNLGYRDIQTILAMTATKFDDPNGTDWATNGAKNWNGGGLHASHDYGFGKVDALAAVRLAETWGETSTFEDQRVVSASATVNQAIPDGAGSVTSSLTLAAGLEVEHAQVSIQLNHANWGDLIVKLISPSGTESILVNRPGKAPGSSSADTGDVGSGTLNFSFGSTHVLGEDSGGTWTLQVIDAATGQAGTLTNWTLDLYGKQPSSDDVYVYTNEYAASAQATPSRQNLSDADGGSDTINAAAVSGNSVIDLNAGQAGQINGQAFCIAAGSTIEQAIGGDGNDQLIGNAADNRLVGGRGNDTLTGGAGNDILDGGQGNDSLTGGAGQDLFMVEKAAGSIDTIIDFDAASEKIALAGFGTLSVANLQLVQEGADTRVSLGDGQSILLRNVAPASLGTNSFVFVERPNISGFTIGSNAADPEVVGTGFQPHLYLGQGGDDRIFGGQGADEIHGGDGNDVLVGEPTNAATYNGGTVLGAGDVLYGDAGDDILLGGVKNDVLRGGTGNDYVQGDAGDDTIYVEGGEDRYYGMTGYYGNSGADRFVIEQDNYAGTGILRNFIGDFDVNQEGEKIDLSGLSNVRSFADLRFTSVFVDGAEFTRVYVGGPGSNQNITLANVPKSALRADNFIFSTNAIEGTAGTDALTGNAGGNTLDGKAGADVMTGRTGDDLYIVDNVGDTVNELPDGGFDTVKASVGYTLSANVENLTLTGVAAIDGSGNDLANRMVGNSADNVLDGKGGVDVLVGGAGNDTYVVDSQADTVIEQAGEGTDTVRSAVSYTLGNNIENLTLTGTASINATGNALANALTGNVGDNLLDGAEGADTMAGGAGDDTYFVDNAGDTVIENLNEGIDTVVASVNYTLGANVENLTLAYGVANGTGNAQDNWLSGNSMANTLTGGAGNDILDGAAGADTLTGGTGDDTYVVDNAGDVVIEAVGEGNDTIVASVSVDLTAMPNVENVVLTGTANLNATGNSAGNRLVGNAGANTLTGAAGADTLDGGAGADTLIGGTGDDTYVVDNAGDVVVENAGAGIDTVISALAVDLTTLSGGNLENATLTGYDNLNVTGNAADNQLTGNSGNNTLVGGAGNDTLDGGAGADTLIGGTGNDTYGVDNALDVVQEAVGEGTDSVISSISYTLGADLENLTLTGSAAINGTGNAGANILAGNAANNVLSGGLGNDTYLFGIGSGNDVIEDVDATPGNLDRVILGAGIVPEDVTVTRNLTHLFLNIATTGQTLSILWAPEQGKAVEQVEFAGGAVWDFATLTSLANFAPQVATPLVDQNATEDQSFSFTVPAGTFSDLDVGDTLSLTATLANGNPLPSWLTFNAATQTFSGTPQNGDVGSMDVKVIAHDGRGAQASDVFRVAVANTNDAPVVAIPLGAHVATDGQSFSFAVPANTFADVDVGDSLTYTATLASGSPLPAWMAFDAVSRTFSGTAPYAAVGNYSLRVLARDSAGATVSNDFAVTVQAKAPTVLGTAASDFTLAGTAGADVIDGLAGDDMISGGAGNDIYLFRRGSGHDTISDTDATLGNVDRIRFGADVVPGDVTVSRTVYDLEIRITGTQDRVTLANWFVGDSFKVEQVEFANGAVWGVSELTSFSATIAATEYQDNIVGTSGADVISALGGRDGVNGLGGDDVIDGGAGDDYLSGGLGNDTFLFGRGSGRDTILNDTSGYSSAETAGLVDTLKFAPDVAPSDVEVSRDQYNLILKIKGTQDQVTLDSWFSTYYPAQLQRVEFANGTVWNTAALTAFVSAPTQGNDYLSGTTGNDTLSGLGGDDNLSGGNGNDTLDGGAGNDALNGGSGNDTYFFGNGYGQDVISDVDFSVNTDRIVMQSGVTPSGVQVSRSETDLYLSLNGGADKLTVSNFFSDDYSKVERIEFADSTVWDVNTIKARLPGATSGNDILQAATTGSSLVGLGGNDILIGAAGNDTLDGGAGNDALRGWGGSDTYLFGRGYGNDTVTGDSSDTLLLGAGIATTDVTLGRNGVDLLLSINGTSDSVMLKDWFYYGNGQLNQIRFNDGTIWTASIVTTKLTSSTSGNDVIVGTSVANTLNGLGGNDQLYGDAGSDTLDGGTGNDVLFGGDGTDTYAFGNGYGQDIVSYVQPWDTQGDTVQFQAGVTPAGVTVTRGSSDLYLSLNGAADRLTLQGWFDNPYYQPQLRFFDGTIWTDADIHTRLPGITEGADIYGGGSTNDTINGLGGDDILLGGDGNDVIDGGAGNDNLDGQVGSDVFLFGRNGGRDVVSAHIFSWSGSVPDTDTLRFKSDVAPGDVVVSRNQGNLYLAIKGTTDRVTLKDWFNPGESNVDQVEFANGTSWNREALTQLAGGWPQAPKIETPLPNQTIAQGGSFQVVVPVYTFADNDVPLSISATLADGSPLPGWLGFNSATRTFSGTPGNSDVGSLNVKVIATDGNGASVADIFALSVANVNDAPVLSHAIVDQAATEDSAFSYIIPANAFTDVDVGDTMTLSATLANGSALPGWLTFDAASRSFSGTPTNGDVGTLNVKVTATDGVGSSAFDTFDLAVMNVNDAPVLAHAIADQAATEDAAFSYIIPANAFTDVDVGDTMTLSATLANGSALPGWLTFDAASRSLSGTPTNGDVGTLSVKVTATDGVGASVFDTFDLAVTNVNDAPVLAHAIADQAATEDAAFSYIIPANAFTDVDVGDSLTLSATLTNGSALPAWLTFNAASRSFSGTPDNDNVGVLSVKVTATDGVGASVFDTFDLVVANVNDAPVVANALPDTVLKELKAFEFQVPPNVFRDDDGDVLSLSITANGGGALPAWLSYDAVRKVFSGTPPAGSAGIVTVELTATDPSGASAVASMTFAVNANRAPTLVFPESDQVATEGQSFSLTLPAMMFTDADIGDTLSLSVSLANGSPLPAWLSFDATTRTLSGTPTNNDVGVQGFKITAVDSAGASVSSAFNISVANVNDTPTGAVIISGTTMQNQALTASNTLADADGLGAISYQWQADSINIADATASSFTLTEAQVGKQVRVVASYVDGRGTAESVVSVATENIANVNDVPTGHVNIIGTAAQNETLVADNTLIDVDGMGSITYQWQQLNNDVWWDIQGATGTSFSLTEAQVNRQVRVMARYVDGHNAIEMIASSPTNTVSNINDVPAGVVSVVGNATQGETLTAGNTLTDMDGLGVVSYQWQASSDGTAWSDIAGATAETFTLGESQVGKQLRVVAGYTDGHGTAESVASSSTSAVANVNDAPVGSLSLSGTVAQGQTLTTSNTLADADGLGTIGYQWQSSIDGTTWNEINGATSASLTLSEGQVGQQVRAVASYTDGHGTVESTVSTATAAISNVNDLPTGGVTVSGTAVQNQILTVSDTLADADGLGTVGYQWQSSTDGTTWSNIGGATASALTLGEAQVGQQVRALANYTDGHGTVESVTSSATLAVANINDAPTGNVTVSGTTAQNQTLTVSNILADVDGLGSIGYQWQSATDGTTWSTISGATAASFTLTEAQVGQQVRAVASYTDGHGTIESVASSATSAVANVNDAPTGSVTITGSALQGQTLTASNTLADSDSLGAISYQWQSSVDGSTWNAITDATAATFTVDEAQVGAQIRAVASYTDGHGTMESVVSTATSAIANVNDAPTGSVSVTGTATQNHILTVSNTVADPDGLGAIGYQWQSSSDGTTWNEINGATTSSLTLTEAQVGQQVRAVATYTDGHGTTESVASPASNAIANINDAPTGSVTLSGTATQNQILTASNTLVDVDGLGAISYLWQTSSDGTSWNSISGATTNTLTLGEAQVGQMVRAVASYTDAHGTAEFVTSSATAAVANVNDLPTGSIEVAGIAAQNQTLTASNTLADADGLGSIAYQWQSSMDGTTWSTIGGASAATFSLGESQVGQQIRVVASYTDGHGTVESVSSTATAVIANINDAPIGTVTISGTATQGQTLTVANTLADIDGLGAISYQWKADGINISGATASSFTLAEAQVDKAISVTASYTDGHGTVESVSSTATAAIANINDAPTGTVIISGTATQNQTLTAANTLADIDGLGTISYQWKADGIAISGATASSFTLAEAQVGKAISVTASYTDGHGTVESMTSAATAAIANINDAPTGTVSVTGTATQGQTLTVANTLADIDGLGAISYQWKADGINISGATASSFTLAEAQVDKAISVTASYTDGHGTVESVSSTATAAIANINDAPTGTVIISGTATQNQTLTAANTLADIDGLGTISYQWKADGIAISGATASSFTLAEAQVGKAISVTASYTDGHGTVESMTSAATAAIANINDAPTGTVSVTGTATQGQTLTAANTLADIDGLGTISYQWKADGIAISGATASSFTLAEAQVGKAISVTASYTDGHGTAESVSSTATAAIANINDAPTGTVTISGTATQGQTLTAANTLADIDGLGTISYQWKADGIAISGATASSFTLAEAQVGKAISVTASYTDGHGTAESVSSTATAAIANINDAPTGTVTISGTATQGQTLTAANTLVDIDGLGTISYQWKADGINIGGATASSFTLAEAQVGKAISVIAIYTDGHGTVESVASSATAAIANINDAPTGTVTISGTTTQNQTLTAANTLADADGLGAIGYQWQSSADAGVTWSAISGATTSTFTLTDAQVGQQVRAVASYTDGHGTAESVVSTATAAIAAVIVNSAPTVAVILADQLATEDSVFTYTIPAGSFADVNVGDTLTYTATQSSGAALPSWLVFNAATRTLSGTPTSTSAGLLTLRVTATDMAGASVSDDFVLDIANHIVGTSAVDSLVGTASRDVIEGLAGNDTLNGGTGIDTLIGGLGNDTYVVDNIGDIVTEGLNEGTDLVQSSVTYTLAANVENLTLTGTTAINGTGNTLNNKLTGNAGVNILDGGVGADTLVGGAGNDTYYVDNTGDITTEAASAGTDTVIAAINWTLATNLENLTLSGSANLSGTGNTAANVLTGNAGDNVLNGGTGIDTLIGGLGNDTYVVDNIGDIVTENANEGTDLVQSSVTYTLAANVENLTLTGTKAINGTGNALNNILIGNSAVNTLTGGAGDDTLDGGVGADKLLGGTGNDIYFVDNASDVITENAGEGTDTVNSTLVYTLATNLENLTLLGTTAINGTGNTVDNILTGNSAANTLTGNAGNDTLDGKAGADILVGGTGNDTFVLDRGYGADTVRENDATAGNTDVAQFMAGIGSDQIWLQHVGNNLEASIIGTADKLIFENWYLGSSYHVEQFKTSDNKVLLDSRVDTLVQAMASFAPPAMGQTTLQPAYQTALAPVISANWQ